MVFGAEPVQWDATENKLFNDKRTCANASGDAAIAACERAIASRKFKGIDLAQLYYNRGVEYAADVRFTPERWGNRPASLWIAEELGCCASG